MPSSRASERLRRLLAVVPYVVQHRGVKLAELAGLFEVPEGELLADLNLLFVSGLPPYGPGDLIEVEVDDEGGVWIDMADYFARPLRLTRAEALDLYLRGKALQAAGGPESEALGSALGRLEAELGDEALGELAGRVEAEGETPALLERFRRAAEERERLRIEYFSASRDEVTDRLVDPEELFPATGHWYVVAWDDAAGGERMFRLDRVRSVEGTGQTFEPRGLAGAGRPLYSPTPEDVDVKLLLGPGARWVAEYYECSEVVERSDGMLQVTLPTRHLAWVAKLLLRLSGEATVIAPDELRDEVRRAAERTLSLYG